MKRKKVKQKSKRTKDNFHHTAVFGLGLLPKQGVPEIKVRYQRTRNVFLGQVADSSAVYTFLKKVYSPKTIELHEQMIVLYVNNAGEILGYYRHTVGGITEVTFDIRLVLATALASTCTGIILSHNHPSGNFLPSEVDKLITKRLALTAKLLNIRLIDHLIITRNSYYSLSDHGEL